MARLAEMLRTLLRIPERQTRGCWLRVEGGLGEAGKSKMEKGKHAEKNKETDSSSGLLWSFLTTARHNLGSLQSPVPLLPHTTRGKVF